MENEFKNILKIIDRATGDTGTGATLFQDIETVSFEDRCFFEEWAEKSFERIKELISTTYGKRQIVFNPFTDVNTAPTAALTLSKFDEGDTRDIYYSLENTLYGQIIIASTDVGVCYLVFFSGTAAKAREILQKEFPGSKIIKAGTPHQKTALAYLKGDKNQPPTLHVKGTSSQLRIWELLTNVPSGKLISYGTLAKATGDMAQDIGIAMGDNRIALLIPCHRIIRSTGAFGQYHWGARRKRAMIIKEAAAI